MALNMTDLRSALDAAADKMRRAKRPAQPVDAAHPLSAEQAAQFAHQGFLVLDSPQFSDADIVWCRRILMSLIDRRVGWNEGRGFDISARSDVNVGTTPQLFRPSLYAPELARWAYRKKALAIAKQLLGPDAVLAGDNCVLKPGRIGGPTPWHQDEAHNDPDAYRAQVTIWIALYDTSPANGALAFIPRSHLQGVLPHRAHGGAQGANAIECCGNFDPSEAQVCPIPAGGLTVHHGLVIHGASANRSDAPRLGYILNYKLPPKPRPELGAFPWNADVGRSIHMRRQAWLRRGGMLVDLLRYCRSDRDNLRHFVSQAWKRLKH